MNRALSRLCCAWLAAALVAGAGAAAAQSPPADRAPGPALDALPGALRVGSAALGPRIRLGLLATGGYGFIEGRPEEGGDHHRLLGDAALSFVPIEYIGAAAGISGIWDMHPDDALGADDSGLGYFWIGLRAAVPLPEGFAIGADARWELHGAEAPDVQIDASRVMVRGLVSLRPASWDLRFDLVGGYCIDGTANAVTDPFTLRRGDRVSLGASNFDRVLLGLAGTWQAAQPVEIFLEGTFEPFVGDNAPSVGRSPIRAALGTRIELATDLRLHAAIEVGLARRSSTEPTEPLVPVEPRIAATLGVSFRPALDSPPAPPAERAARRETPRPTPAAPTATVVGTVISPRGTPVAGAQVELMPVEGERVIASTTSDDSGRYRFEHAEPGWRRVRITAQGFDPRIVPVEVPREGERRVAPETLAVPAPAAAIRGLVRDFSGRPVHAQITIQPGARRAETDADGFFEVPVDAGTYEVDIRAQGFAAQHRRVDVSENGVTILNVDLRSARE